MNEEEFPADVALLHLSDIHFRDRRAGDAHDADADLRNELERDLRILRGTRVPKLDGMIVSGDIAFGGKKDEFDFATGWIERVRELMDCPKNGIMVAPGTEVADGAFNDIEGLASQCRFRNCRHDTEPDCAVRSAVARGDLDAARLSDYIKQIGGH
jgi:3',5'-cyclic AMP phosphodiesterase CpdA